MLSNCVECQGVLGDKFGFLRLSIAFKMHTSLCMAATSATLNGLLRQRGLAPDCGAAGSLRRGVWWLR
jgi:hypothetical protein